MLGTDGDLCAPPEWECVGVDNVASSASVRVVANELVDADDVGLVGEKVGPQDFEEIIWRVVGEVGISERPDGAFRSESDVGEVGGAAPVEDVRPDVEDWFVDEVGIWVVRWGEDVRQAVDADEAEVYSMEFTEVPNMRN